MPASPTTTAVQQLILNTVFAVSGESGPLLASLETFAPGPPWRRVSGDTAPLRVVLVDNEGDVPATPRRVILATGNTLHLYAKRAASDADLALELNFIAAGSAGEEYYEADPGTLAVDNDVFNGEGECVLQVDFVEKDSGGDILRSWRTSLYLIRSTVGGSVSAPTYFVSYNPQSPTAPQQAQALTNLGGTTVGKAVFAAVDAAAARSAIGAGTSSFDPASPGTIGGTTPGIVNSTSFVGPEVKATSSAGLALKDSAGGTIATFGNSTTPTTGIYFDSDSIYGFVDGYLTFQLSTVAGALSLVGGPLFGNTIRALTSSGLTINDSSANTVGTFGTATSWLNLGEFVTGVSGSYEFGKEEFLVRESVGTAVFSVNLLTGDVSFGSGLTTKFDFNGNLTVPIIAATTSAGGTITSANGTTCASWGAGNGANFTIVSLSVTDTLTLAAFTEGTVAIGNSGTSKTLSIAAGTVQTCTLTGNCTFTMPNATAGKSFTILLNTGAGSYTATFTGVKWSGGTAPAITTTASRLDILTFVADGTNWYGSALQNFTP